MPYQLIYADPPWEYDNAASRGAAKNHYPTMKLEDMKRLPVWALSEPNSVLVMWYTGNFADEAQELAKAWGFKVKQMFCFTWVKWTEQAERTINKSLEKQPPEDFYDLLALVEKVTRMNGGNYSRQNQESCLVAVRGRGLERHSASVKQVIYSPMSDHSAKPAEARIRLEQLYGDVSRIELFARTAADGWDCWGNQCDSSVQLITGRVA